MVDADLSEGTEEAVEPWAVFKNKKWYSRGKSLVSGKLEVERDSVKHLTRSVEMVFNYHLFRVTLERYSTGLNVVRYSLDDLIKGSNNIRMAKLCGC